MKMYDKIKKQNGEAFAKAIRSYDNGIFDIPHIDKIVKYAGDEAEPLLNYLVSLKEVDIKEKKQVPFFGDLLEQAGYDYIIADTAEKQNSTKKFYRPNERICTFGSDRYKKYHIIHIWKKNAEDIKPLPKPSRDDEYSTSVLSIQIAKSGGFIKIVSRYNHTVNNCDNTLNSNPDNIIEGLGQAFKNYFKVDFTSQKTKISGDYHIYKDMILKYNYEISGAFIGKDFYLKDGELHTINPDKELLIEKFILDIQTKTLRHIIPNYTDSFVEAFNEEVKDKKLIIIKNPDYVEQEGEFAIIKE